MSKPLILLSLLLATMANAASDAVPKAPPASIAAPARPVLRSSSSSITTDQAGTPAKIETGPERVVISGMAQVAEVECEGRVATVQGQYLVVQLKGACSQLSVLGNANVVSVDSVASIEVRGDDNAITWYSYPGDLERKKAPFLANVGARNQVVPGELPPQK